LCDGVAEGWGEEVEDRERQGSYEDAVDHCEGWVLDYWVMWMKGISKQVVDD